MMSVVDSSLHHCCLPGAPKDDVMEDLSSCEDDPFDDGNPSECDQQPLCPEIGSPTFDVDETEDERPPSPDELGSPPRPDPIVHDRSDDDVFIPTRVDDMDNLIDVTGDTGFPLPLASPEHDDDFIPSDGPVLFEGENVGEQHRTCVHPHRIP